MTSAMAKPTEPAGECAMIHVATQIIFYRSPRPRSRISALDKYAAMPLQGFRTVLYFDGQSLSSEFYPLRYQLNLICIINNPFHWIQMHINHQTPRGGRPVNVEAVEVVHSLLRDFVNFPHGFERYPLDSTHPAITPELAKEQNNDDSL